MSKPMISWYVKRYQEQSYTSQPDYYAGNVVEDNNLVVELQVWNNRYGTEVVDDLKNFNIAIKFQHIEDSVLLQYISLILNNSDTLSIDIEGDVAVATMPENIILSGGTNDGSEEYTDNFLLLRLTIEIPANVNVKMNDIKNMVLNIVEI